MHLFDGVSFHCKNTKDLAEHGALVALDMFHIFWKHPHEKSQLTLGHGLDDKLPVVAKEEETAGPSSSFTSFKDRISVELRTQARMEEHERNQVVFFKNLLKVAYTMVSHSYCLINLKDILVIAMSFFIFSLDP